MNHLGLIACATLALLAILIAPACRDERPPQLPVPPAAAEVADLTAREHAAGLAAAEASARGDTAAAEYHSRLAGEIAALRRQAEDRQHQQQAEIEKIAQREALHATEIATARQLAQDRRWAGIAIGACLAAAVALSLLRLPAWIALGLPAAAAAGLLWVAAWSSVPWLAWALGLVVACALLLGVVGLLIYAVREWRQWAADRETMPRAAADAASLARQPRPVRWALDWVLGARR